MSISARGARTPLVTLAAVMVWTGIQLDSLEVSAQAISSPPECRARIGRVNKRRRCVACVRRAGMMFLKQGAGHGHCRSRVVAPPAAPRIIRSIPGCRAHSGRLKKQARCEACVHRGGAFHKQGGGHGFCRAGVVAPAPHIIRAAAGCHARIGRLGKRQRCVACVRRGGVFHKQGAAAGFCRGGAPLVNKGVVITTSPACVAHIGRPNKRRRCQACVIRGMVFHRQGGAAGFCRPRAAPPAAAGPIRHAAGCRARVGRLSKRNRCIACVHRGGTFHKRGGSTGFCAESVAPKHRPGVLRTVHQCRTSIGRHSKKRRCIACVRRGGRFLRQGAAHGICR